MILASWSSMNAFCASWQEIWHLLIGYSHDQLLKLLQNILSAKVSCQGNFKTIFFLLH